MLLILNEKFFFPSRPNMQRCHIVMEFQSCSDSALPSVLQLTILVLQTIIPILIRFSQRSFKFRTPSLGEEDISIPVYLDPASVTLAAEFIKYSIACLKLVMARVQEHQSSVIEVRYDTRYHRIKRDSDTVISPSQSQVLADTLGRQGKALVRFRYGKSRGENTRERRNARCSF